MHLFRHWQDCARVHPAWAATIGNFDGMHRGHQAVLAALREQAQARHLPALAILFEPQPLEFLRPEAAPARLTSTSAKLRRLRESGIEGALCIRFNARFAALSAAAFVDEVLVRGAGLRYLMVGDDFRFGRGREGDFALLCRAGEESGFEVQQMDTHLHAQERISSTRIRAALAAGDLETAAALLGRPHGIEGRVMHGDKRGRELGFPTANLALRVRALPMTGVFVVRAGVHGQAVRWPGVANLGLRPTVDGKTPRLEVHLFDFAGDLYGRRLEVEFLHRLRGEQRFESLAALRQQIAVDAAAARAWLGLVS
jgi:riboflavin kinase/FMN adenylyltransferase